MREESQGGVIQLLLKQFASPLVLILVFVAIVSLALRQWVDSAIILVVVVGIGGSILSSAALMTCWCRIPGLRGLF